MPYSIRNGLLEGGRWLPSPNFEARPRQSKIELLVIHCISLPPGKYGKDQRQSHHVEDFFLNKLDCSKHEYFKQLIDLRVSAHIFIERNGEVTQFVNFNDRAWHAGESCFNGRENCNDYSIGIELEGIDTDRYTRRQYTVLTEVTRAIQLSYPSISNDRIVGHEHIAPIRKTDPGAQFDWLAYKGSLMER